MPMQRPEINKALRPGLNTYDERATTGPTLAGALPPRDPLWTLPKECWQMELVWLDWAQRQPGIVFDFLTHSTG